MGQSYFSIELQMCKTMIVRNLNTGPVNSKNAGPVGIFGSLVVDNQNILLKVQDDC